MSCPICESLHREHTELCGKEAELTLAEREIALTPAKRKTSANATASTESTVDAYRPGILSARRRQMQVVSELKDHKALAHSA
jgi:hypothetical protein